jgi:CxxC-x17-CxxC domain-containing protein
VSLQWTIEKGVPKPKQQDPLMAPDLINTRTGQTRPICVDCGEPFERTPEEVAARRGTGMPVSPRCPACRLARREEHNACVLAALRDGDLRGAQTTPPRAPEGGARLYPAVCADCRRPIRLPFKPRLDRPIFCRFCRDARDGR